MTSRPSRKRHWIYAPFLFGFLGSMFTHGSVVIALLFGAAGRASGAGENGKSGAGDTTVDVTVAGNASTSAPADTTPPTPTTPPAPTTPPVTKPLPLTKDDTADPLPDLTPPPEKHVTPQTAGNADATHSGQLAGPTRIGLPNAGASGDTVEGQRALLPKAMTCNDPVAGRWTALKYNPMQGDWVNFTLTVARAADGTLSGTILSHTWSGSVFDLTPPTCTLGGFDLTVSMSASGRADASGRITFGASRYSIVSVRCPVLDNSYAPDHFSGTVDVARQEFQSLNNDGANDVNAPYVFRRIGCQ